MQDVWDKIKKLEVERHHMHFTPLQKINVFFNDLVNNISEMYKIKYNLLLHKMSYKITKGSMLFFYYIKAKYCLFANKTNLCTIFYYPLKCPLFLL